MSLFGGLTSLFTNPVATIAGSALSFLGGENRNDAQIASAREQMDFQERMSSTAYQRAMSDMKKAGLNPILAGKLGGASSPGGAMPQLQDTITPALNTGVQIAQAGSNIDLQKTQANLNETNELLRQNMIPLSEAVATITSELGKMINSVNDGIGGAEGLMTTIAEQYQKMDKWGSPEGLQTLKDAVKWRIDQASDAVQDAYDKYFKNSNDDSGLVIPINGPLNEGR